MVEASNELPLTEGDFCRIQAQLIIEIVAACSMPELSADERLTEIANRLYEMAISMDEHRHKAVVREIAGVLMSTES